MLHLGPCRCRAESSGIAPAPLLPSLGISAPLHCPSPHFLPSTRSLFELFMMSVGTAGPNLLLCHPLARLQRHPGLPASKCPLASPPPTRLPAAAWHPPTAAHLPLPANLSYARASNSPSPAASYSVLHVCFKLRPPPCRPLACATFPQLPAQPTNVRRAGPTLHPSLPCPLFS